MRRIVAIVAPIIIFLFFAKSETFAQGYSVTGFSVLATINQDTSVTIKETIETNFQIQKHGIYRDIPVIYSTPKGKLNIRLKVLSVTDISGAAVKYTVSQSGGSVRIKIGDAKKYLRGPNSYVITYTARNVIQRFEDHDEFYWNVVGDKWDVDIPNPKIEVISAYAEFSGTACYLGQLGSNTDNCSKSLSTSSVRFASYGDTAPGSDFTVVVGLNKQNLLVFPTQTQATISYIQDNIWTILSYVFAISPLLLFGYFWYRFGRDQRYASENIYYAQMEDKVEAKPLFAREYLPLAYMRVGDLTPAEAGTLIDERVDMADIVAEIMELGRLGYLTITRKDKKMIIGRKKDFLLKRKKKDTSGRADYQKFLLEKLFGDSDEVKLTDLKLKFYKHLPELKKKLYKEVTDKSLFVDNPEVVRKKWGIVYVLFVAPFVLLSIGSVLTPLSIVIYLFSLAIGALFLINLPRRTAKGYGLYRQLKGLKDYLKRGKWKHEIAEKHLFLEEMLPMAISLNVVKELTRDMKDLGVEPPSYVSGVTTANLATFATDFRTTASSSLSGGKSSSGGSGFSGGAGGGFGGGGGGSW